MKYRIFMTADARSDLERLHDFIGEHDCWDRANYVLDEIEKLVATLTISPLRGVVPKELQALGLANYREIFFKPYRIIYMITKPAVYIMLIADGRRDMQTLLEQRLLRV